VEEDGERGEGDGKTEEAGLQRLLHVGTPGAIAGAVQEVRTSRASRGSPLRRPRSVVRGSWTGHGAFVLRIVRAAVLRSRFGAWLHRFPWARDQRMTTRETFRRSRGIRPRPGVFRSWATPPVARRPLARSSSQSQAPDAMATSCGRGRLSSRRGRASSRDRAQC
jgi:hypothetical protein